MAESEKTPQVSADRDLPTNVTGPLVFISHDNRDGDLAEAFSKLLKSVSAGMLKSFRSTDKKGNEGIDFGDEWYEKLMTKLEAASDVVCLFTERSLDRPWILYEVGVAKGKLNRRVHGIALGVTLNRVNTGPFYYFQNCDGSEEELTKLVLQLARRVPGIEPDADVVRTQVKAFKASVDKILEKLGGKGDKPPTEENPMARLVEEMKALVRDLPSRVAERMSELGDPFRRKRLRRFNPMMIEDLLHMTGDPGDPVGILMAASVIRDDAPWLYEIAMDAYRAAKSGDPVAVKREITRIHHFSEIMMRGPFMEEFGMGGKEMHMFFMEFPRMLEHMLHRTIEERKPVTRRRTIRPPAEST
ncbi:MAG: toll/interleukin-1 receptor domain-containing protein [Candidatus Aminicenantales bacterium]